MDLVLLDIHCFGFFSLVCALFVFRSNYTSMAQLPFIITVNELLYICKRIQVLTKSIAKRIMCFFRFIHCLQTDFEFNSHVYECHYLLL